MSWYYVDAGGDASTTFFAIDVDRGSTTKQNILLTRYSSVTGLASASITINTWRDDGLNGSNNDPVIPLITGEDNFWMLLPSDNAKYDTYGNWKPWISVDNGATWSEAKSPLTGMFDFTKGQVQSYTDANNKPTFVISVEQPSRKPISFWSKDLGQTWARIKPMVNPSSPNSLFEIKIKGSGRRGVAGIFRDETADGTGRSFSGVYYSANEGETWRTASGVFTTGNAPNLNGSGSTAGVEWFNVERFVTINEYTGVGDAISRGDVDPPNQIYIGSGGPADSPNKDGSGAFDYLFVGNKTWIRSVKLGKESRGIGSNAPITTTYSPNRVAITYDNGTTWSYDTTGRFDAQVYSNKNHNRVRIIPFYTGY